MTEEIKNDELQKYKAHLVANNLSTNTINQYMKYLTAYVKKYQEYPDNDEEDVYQNIDKFVIEKANGKPVKSTKAQTLKAICSYRNYKNLPRDKIVKMYGSVNEEAKQDAEMRNAKLNETLPTLKEHTTFVDGLYDLTDLEKIRAYVINKLILNCYVRNKDLVAKIITKKGQLKHIADDENYLHIQKNKVTFVRRNYKTAKTYGEKIDDDCVGKNEKTKFVKALRTIMKLSGGNNLLPDIANLADYVIRQTNNLGETKLLKMSLRAKNSLADATKIGEKRGTALPTLQQNYNLVE
jgi:hypothetical protein